MPRTANNDAVTPNDVSASANPPETIAVLLVEDDVSLAGLLKVQLSERGYRVEIISDGRLVVRAITDRPYNILLLDRMLPSVDGVEILRQLRGQGIETPVIMLTALGRIAERVEGLDHGADDYIVKPLDVEELDARIRAVLRRRAPSAQDSATVSVGGITVSLAQHKVTRAGKLIEMHRMDMRLLAELMKEAGNVMTRPMLLERVWGYDFIPTTNIVEAHIMRLRQRLTMPGLPDPIQTVRGIGYLFKT